MPQKKQKETLQSNFRNRHSKFKENKRNIMN